MKVSKIADKIISELYKEFMDAGSKLSYGPNWLQSFPDEDPEKVYAAIRLLSSDGLLDVLFANDAPTEMELKEAAIRKVDDDTLLKRGYALLKEIRSWI